MFESQLCKGMKIGFIRTFLINLVFIPIVMRKMPGSDISATFKHSATTMRTETILLTTVSFVDMYQYTALRNSVMLLHSILIIHGFMCLLVYINKIHFLSQSGGNLCQNVKTYRIASILNTTEISCIDACKTRKVSCINTTLFTDFLYTIAYSSSVLMSRTTTDTEDSSTYAKLHRLTPDVVDHSLFVIREILIKQSFEPKQFLFSRFLIEISTDLTKDSKHFSIWSSDFNLSSINNLG